VWRSDVRGLAGLSSTRKLTFLLLLINSTWLVVRLQLLLVELDEQLRLASFVPEMESVLY